MLAYRLIFLGRCSKSPVDELVPEFTQTFGKKAVKPYCVSLAWSADGSTLYAGYTDGIIRVYVVLPSTA